MAWTAIPNNTLWEYDNAPPDPGGAETELWTKQSNGIRLSPFGIEVYTKCRMIGKPVDIIELSHLIRCCFDNK